MDGRCMGATRRPKHQWRDPREVLITCALCSCARRFAKEGGVLDGRWGRRLPVFYPAGWRVRYGDEFAAFLEEKPSTLGEIVDVVLSAIRERVDGGGVGMDSRQQSLVLMTYA